MITLFVTCIVAKEYSESLRICSIHCDDGDTMMVMVTYNKNTQQWEGEKNKMVLKTTTATTLLLLLVVLVVFLLQLVLCM